MMFWLQWGYQSYSVVLLTRRKANLECRLSLYQYCTPRQNSTKITRCFIFSLYHVVLQFCTYKYGTALEYYSLYGNYVKQTSKRMYNYNNKNSSTVEIKMVFTQPPPHHQQQQRYQHEAQIPQKWKTLLRQNLHLLRKIAEVQQ